MKRHHLCQSPVVDATTNPRNVILWTRHPPTAHEHTFPVLSTRPLVISHMRDKEDGTSILIRFEMAQTVQIHRKYDTGQML